MTSLARYAVVYSCKGQKDNQGTGPGWFIEPGKRVWITRESEGWVPCTTMSYIDDTHVPGDVMTWDTRKEASDYFLETVIRKMQHHPWYSEPDGGYMVVEIQQEFKMVPCGWRMM